MTIMVARDIVRRRLQASRDHDAYWGQPSRGWRCLGEINHGLLRVEEQLALDALAELVEAGEVEANGTGSWRWREPVVPVGGDARMAQA